MEAVKTWAFSVCAAMVACGLAQMVLPRGSMEKVFRMTVSVFFLCCLLSPVVLRDPGLRIEVREYAQQDIDRRAQRLADEAAAQAGTGAEGELRKIIAEKLAGMGINYRDITINMNISGQSAPEAIQVDILLDKAHEREHREIHDALEEALGVQVRLGYAGGEG